MKSFRGVFFASALCFVLPSCSSEDFNLSNIASTTLSGLSEKIGQLSLTKIGEKIGIDNQPKVKLAPAPIPIYAVGDTFVYSADGKLVQEQVVNASPDRVTWTNDKGMIWSTSNDLVTPQLSWSAHPELGRGRQTIIGNPEAIFPLKEGNSVAFGIRGNSENVPTGWRDEKKCVVVGQKDINVTAGDFTTFHIACSRKGIKEDLYYAPIAQNYVLRTREFANTKSQKELISVRLADDRTKHIPAKMTRPEKERQTRPKPIEVIPNSSASKKAEVDALIAKLEKILANAEKSVGAGQNPAAGDKRTESKRSGKYGIHLASYRTVKGARKGWKALKKKHPKELKGLSFATTEFDSGKKGTYIRLLGISFKSKASANKFCKKLKVKRQYCKGERARP